MAKNINKSFIDLFNGSRVNTTRGQQSSPSLSSSTVHDPLIPPVPSSSSNYLSNFYSSTSYKGGTFDNHHQKSSDNNYISDNKHSVGDIQTIVGVGANSNKSSTTTLSEATSLYSQQLYDVIRNQACNSSIHGGNGKTTWKMAAFLLINAALGAGILNYPVAYNRLGGVVYATIIQIIISFLLISTIAILIYCAEINNEDSYHGVIKIMCGPGVSAFSAASIAITCMGICITLLIVAGDQYDQISVTYIGRDFCTHWYANRFFTITGTAIVAIWPMCYFRRLDFLRHINVFGVMASFYIIFLNIYEYFYHKPDPKRVLNIRTTPESALEFIAALPVVFFAYQTHEIVIPVYDSMREKNFKSFFKSISTAMIALLVLYCLAGSFGYLTFGSNVAPDIMLMYDANDPVVLVGIVALIVKMITIYPPVVFAGRDTIVRLILSRYYQSYRGYQCLNDNSGTQSTLMISHERKYNILITTVWNMLALILALIIPNITIAIGFLGSLASCNVFIFPGLALLSLAKRHSKMRRKKFIFNFEDDNDDDDEDVRPTQQPKIGSNRYFSLKNRFIQNILYLYGLFIIGLGIIMFVIILIQVYYDFQNHSDHGAVCDVFKGSSITMNNTITATSTIAPIDTSISSTRYLGYLHLKKIVT